ncbi:MAG: hypothetical protein AAGH15_18185 [Myxococcota bacterium]
MTDDPPWLELRATTDAVACSLGGAAFRERLSEFRETFADGYRGHDELARGVRWRFVSRPDLRPRLASLATREHACCPFFHFVLRDVGDETWWEIRVGPAEEALLPALRGLPSS